MSGIMSITGEPAGGPMRAGFAICDTIGGMTAALAVSSALYQRTHTGRGQFVDVAMLDAALAFIPGPVVRVHRGRHRAEADRQRLGEPQADGQPLPRQGRLHRPRRADREAVRRASCARIGRADALDDPRFKDWAARTDNVAALREVIEGALATDDPKTWETRLTAADVPCACIWKIDEIVEHPQLEHRDVLQTVDSRYGPMRLVGAGFRLAHGSPGIDRAAADARRAHRRDPRRGRLRRRRSSALRRSSSVVGS